VNDDALERRRFKADAHDLRPMSTWWREWARHAGLTSETCDRGELCLNEAVGNIIQHSTIDDERAVDVVLERSPDAVRITVIDSGDRFNPLERPSVELPSSLENATIGRLGIPLMRVSADDISYRRDHGQNLLTFRFER
jgi:anti-sigma regulatory factor (Ser/Thr protein kinase)